MDVAAVAKSVMGNYNNINGKPNENYDTNNPIGWALPTGPYKMSTSGNCRFNQIFSGGIAINPPFDGTVQTGPSGFGGILRDERGRWVRGFIGFIGDSDGLTVEFHGIHCGLLLLDKLGLKGSVLESGYLAATKWITDKSYHPTTKVMINCWDIVVNCRRLVDKNEIIVRCCPSNKCADKFANMAVEKREPFMEIMDVPNEIKEIVDYESSIMWRN
ncbi:uncharacterized protein [Rutidosis leptorrhynchoides]|uniref:uncharacterized protein n=1 Tax=Rutidosis leptorrhynchoides TaxID=125765 RepID=UPI003A9A0CBD